MTTSSLIILADRGGLKAYSVTETPTRGPSLRLVDEFQITGAERELPFNVESSQRHIILMSDWMGLDAETNCRVAFKDGRSRLSRRFTNWLSIVCRWQFESGSSSTSLLI